MLDTLKTKLDLKNPALLREQSYINGEWVSAWDGATFPVTNPADGSLVATVPEMEVVGARTAIEAADAGLKGAEVTLWQLRLADGLGGKGIVLFAGLVADVETAVEIAVERAQRQLLNQVVISQLHSEMKENVATYGRFGVHFDW